MARILYLDDSSGRLRMAATVLPPWLPVAPKTVMIFCDILVICLRAVVRQIYEGNVLWLDVVVFASQVLLRSQMLVDLPGIDQYSQTLYIF